MYGSYYRLTSWFETPYTYAPHRPDLLGDGGRRVDLDQLDVERGLVRNHEVEAEELEAAVAADVAVRAAPAHLERVGYDVRMYV